MAVPAFGAGSVWQAAGRADSRRCGRRPASPLHLSCVALGCAISSVLRLLVGSIANLIVVGLAEKAGVIIDWKQHARIGLPVTLLSLALLWFCWQVLGIQPPPKVSS